MKSRARKSEPSKKLQSVISSNKEKEIKKIVNLKNEIEKNKKEKEELDDFLKFLNSDIKAQGYGC